LKFESIQTLTNSGLASYSGQGSPAVQPVGLAMNTCTVIMYAPLALGVTSTEEMNSNSVEPPKEGQ